MTSKTTFNQPPFGNRGADFWLAVTSEFELTRTEKELLAEACKTLDDLEALAEALKSQGVIVTGSMGQTRANPLVSELRQHRLMLSRLLAQLALPDEAGETLKSPTAARLSLAGKAGARAKWGA